MERAILKTLAYYDIFDFPLKAWEIHKWLLNKNASLKQVEKNLKKLNKELRIKKKGDYWFFSSRKGLIKQRIDKEAISSKHMQTAKYISLLFRIIPWIKLVGVSGSLAMMDSSEGDDIDLFIITSKKRIWLSRLILILITSLTGLRRTRREKLLSASGKICINLILEEDNLAQQKRNIYVAHEILQMKVLWQRQEVYSNFLHTNDWAFKYLPNWKSGVLEKRQLVRNKGQIKSGNNFTNLLEETAKKLQLRIMNNPSGSERIENGALYFHPEDKGVKILAEYNMKIKKLLS